MPSKSGHERGRQIRLSEGRKNMPARRRTLKQRDKHSNNPNCEDYVQETTSIKKVSSGEYPSFRSAAKHTGVSGYLW